MLCACCLLIVDRALKLTLTVDVDAGVGTSDFAQAAGDRKRHRQRRGPELERTLLCVDEPISYRRRLAHSICHNACASASVMSILAAPKNSAAVSPSMASIVPAGS